MTIQSILDNASKAIALLSFSILILTVIHDWGYFWVVGLRFQSMQTPYDYLANSMEWLPYHLATLMLTGFVLFILETAGVGKGPEFPSGLEYRRRRKTRNVIYALSSVLVVIMTAFLRRSDLSAIVLNVAVGYPILVVLLGQFPWFPARTRPARFALLLPALVLFAFGLGVRAAELAVRSTESVYKLDLKDSPSTSANLLRSMEKGILIWDEATQRAALIRWEKIERISHVVGSRKDEESFACGWLEFFCRNIPPSP